MAAAKLVCCSGFVLCLVLVKLFCFGFIMLVCSFQSWFANKSACKFYQNLVGGFPGLCGSLVVCFYKAGIIHKSKLFPMQC